MKYLNKIQKWMYGRYGVDNLYHFLLYTYILIAIINIFLASKILTLIELLIVIINFYIIFSKNIKKRRAENNLYLKIKEKIKKPFKKIKRNYQDRSDYIYRRCHKCKKELRLPLPDKKGIKYVTCPNCKHKNRYLITREQKIEIIKKGRKK